MLSCIVCDVCGEYMNLPTTKDIMNQQLTCGNCGTEHNHMFFLWAAIEELSERIEKLEAS